MRGVLGRVAVVTGAASGIGLGMATRFAAAGMRVMLADVEAGSLAVAESVVREAAEAVALAGGGAGGAVAAAVVASAVVDVADSYAVEALAVNCYARFGAVHVVCNNAGVGGGGRQSELTVADWDWVLGVNLHGVVHGIAAFLPRMVAGGEPGHIVNTASMAGHVAAAGMRPYNASKYAVVGLSESLAKELDGGPIGVSVLCPGWVNTRIAESGRNRPGGQPLAVAVPDDAISAVDLARREYVRQALATGLQPSEVAEMVLDAILAERFWIFTHPEMLPAIRARADDLLAGVNPTAARVI